MAIRISKVLYFLLVIYYGWFQIVQFQIPNILLILGIGIMAFIILDALNNRINLLKSLTIEISSWIIFAFTSLFFGMIVASNQDYLFDGISTYFQFLILMFSVIYISSRENNINFFMNVFIFLAVISALTTIFRGFNYGGGRMSMGINNNPNSLGITMAIGICCVLYKINFNKFFHSITSSLIILLFIYVTLLTGSRKSFLSVALLVIVWVIFIANKDFKASGFAGLMKGILSLSVLIGISYFVLYPYLKNSLMLSRLVDLFKSGDETREGMYKVAFYLFEKSPFIGIGFNNYQAMTRYDTYSHSTYAEALACTGLIGCIFYFYPYLLILRNYFILIFNKEIDDLLLKQARVMFAMFLILLFLGIGVIHFYSMTSSIAFGMLIAYYKITKDKFGNYKKQ